MADKTDAFVTSAVPELQEIKRLLEQAAIKSQVLANKWQALGKTSMSGWETYNWAGRQFDKGELATALNGLTVALVTEDAVNLTNLHTAKPIDKIVKAGL